MIGFKVDLVMNYKKRPVGLGDILKKTFSGRYTPRQKSTYSVDDSPFDFFALIRTWPEIIGERTSQHTVPLKNVNKTLTVLCNHPAFAQQLAYIEDVIIKKIGEKYPKLKNQIKKINFINDSTHFDKQKLLQANISKEEEKVKESENKTPVIHPYSPLYYKLKAESDELFRDIESEEMKDILFSIYMQSKT